MISIDTATLATNLPSEDQPCWIALPHDLADKDALEIGSGLSRQVVEAWSLGDREDAKDLEQHLAAVIVAWTSMPLAEGFSARMLFLPDPTGLGVAVDFAALPAPTEHSGSMRDLHAALIGGEELDQGSCLDLEDEAGYYGLATVEVAESEVFESDDGPMKTLTGQLTCVVRRSESPLGPTDIVACAASDDLELLSLALVVLPTFIQGDSLFSE